MDTTSQVGMVRPLWEHRQHFLDQWKAMDITVLVCQRKTCDLIRLTLESLFRFYPDIPVVVVDGNSQDDSTLYLRYKALVTPNLKLVELNNTGVNSHGVTMDNAIREHITTKYVLLMDSDLIIERHGFIEGMLFQMRTESLYATGSLMLVTYSNQGCGEPKDENDILRYAHPSCSIYDREVYLTLKPFVDHGAPCCYNMMEAQNNGLKVGYYPVDKYVSHLSGASWCVPATIWDNSHSVPLRPFITFITEDEHHIIAIRVQSDHDFDIITPGNHKVVAVVQHHAGKFDVDNRLYDIRFAVQGEYICHLLEGFEDLTDDFVHLAKLKAIEEKAPDEMLVAGILLYKRSHWQRKICLE